MTLPFGLQARVGFDGTLLGAVARVFVDSVLGWYRQRLRTSARERVESGAVVVVQRASSDLKLNPFERQCAQVTAAGTAIALTLAAALAVPRRRSVVVFLHVGLFPNPSVPARWSR